MHRTKYFGVFILWIWASASFGAAPADSVYHNGYVYTVDARDSIQQAIAVRGGKIVYVGSNTGVKQYIGKSTDVTDLHGRMLMPGLVDAHMHPLEGGAQLMHCDLNYDALTVPQFQARIQQCLDKTKDKEPDNWLEVYSWFQQNMQPPGTEVTKETLDTLKTKRPILVRSSFGHTTLANSRAMELTQITAATPNPAAGLIAHDAKGNPTGIFEDRAQALFDELLPERTEAENIASAAAALDALRKQGVTTFLDASCEPPNIAAFATLQKKGKLTARAHFAPVLAAEEGKDPKKAVGRVMELVRKYDQGALQIKPTITVRNVKLFLDGVIAAPSLTGVMVEPYFVNKGTKENPQWSPGTSKGPEPYFQPDVLKPLLLQIASAGLDPHIHADGDGAVRFALDGIEAMRKKFPASKIRAATAHNEIVVPADLQRFAQTETIPVLSFQWGKPAADTVDNCRDILGPERFRIIEPQGLLHQAKARIAFGSDWPVDRLDQWFALKVGVTRTAAPEAGPKYAGKLGDDPGLSPKTVVRASTINSSYALHQDAETGSLEPGKLADFIVLDRNLFKIPNEEIANIKVLMTVVGGEVVYRANLSE